MDKKLPLVSESNGRKLKKLGFDWEVNVYFNDFNQFTESITLSGANYNESKYSNIGNIAECCSIPTLALAFQWLVLKHGIYLGKDWVEMDFSLIDFKTSEPEDYLAVVDLAALEGNVPDDAIQQLLEHALDYLIKMFFPVFGDTVRLTNNRVGRCIGNNKAIFILDTDKEEQEFEVGDIDLHFLRNSGKNNFPTKYIVPKDKDIEKFRMPTL